MVRPQHLCVQLRLERRRRGREDVPELKGVEFHIEENEEGDVRFKVPRLWVCHIHKLGVEQVSCRVGDPYAGVRVRRRVDWVPAARVRAVLAPQTLFRVDALIRPRPGRVRAKREERAGVVKV